MATKNLLHPYHLNKNRIFLTASKPLEADKTNEHKVLMYIVKLFSIFQVMKLLKKWNGINLELIEREKSAEIVMGVLSDYKENPKQQRLIAETVMTIENAQVYLTQKADSFYRLGLLTALSAVILMLVMGLHLLLDISISIPKTAWMPTFVTFETDKKNQIPNFNETTKTTFHPSMGTLVSIPSVSTLKTKELNATEVTVIQTNHTYDFIAYTMKRLAGGGFIAGLVILLISLARSFFHESTAFKNERHNIRLGKLIPYAVKPEDMNYKEFQEVTQWGKESNSAFKDISPESSGKTILTYSVEALKAMSEAVKNTKNQDNTSQTQGTSK